MGLYVRLELKQCVSNDRGSGDSTSFLPVFFQPIASKTHVLHRFWGPRNAINLTPRLILPPLEVCGQCGENSSIHHPSS